MRRFFGIRASTDRRERYEALDQPVIDALANLAHLEIHPSRWEIQKDHELVSGGFGSVKVVKLGKELVAMKQLHFQGDRLGRSRFTKRFARELTVWARLEHPNLVKLSGYYLSRDLLTAQFICPFYPLGNIRRYLEENCVNYVTRRGFAADTATGLQYLHDKNIVHGDLKDLNVLIDDQLHALLCDYGMSKAINPDGRSSGLTTNGGSMTLPYASPEVLLGEPQDFPSDIWAWGCLFLKIIAGQDPYGTGRKERFYKRVLVDKETPCAVSSIFMTEPFQRMLTQCWDWDVSARPSIAQCLMIIREERTLPNDSEFVKTDHDLVKLSGRDTRPPWKIILLGAAESGKSTVFRRLRLSSGADYNEPERVAYRTIIFSNTVQSMSAILRSLPQLGLTLSINNKEDASLTVLKAADGLMQWESLPVTLVNAISVLYGDPAIKTALKRSREFQLIDSAAYFFDSLERFAAPGYLPTNDEILRSYARTTDITDTLISYRESAYAVYDLGGRRSERRKWIHCFENVTALIFIVSLSEYDQVLYEDESVNRMVEAITLFEAVINSGWFTKSSIILFLNKIDLLRSKLGISSVKSYFPDYDGPDDGSDADFDYACEFFRTRFMGMNQAHKRLITHLTCIMDSKQIRLIFRAINEHILQSNLEQVGFA